MDIDGAFAAILADGSVVTWGDPTAGGDSTALKDQLRKVQEVQGGGRAFVAILDDGSALTWGDPTHGGESSHIQHQLRHVQKF